MFGVAARRQDGSATLIYEQVLLGVITGRQDDDLSALILFAGGHPNISEFLHIPHNEIFPSIVQAFAALRHFCLSSCDRAYIFKWVFQGVHGEPGADPRRGAFVPWRGRFLFCC